MYLYIISVSNVQILPKITKNWRDVKMHICKNHMFHLLNNTWNLGWELGEVMLRLVRHCYVVGTYTMNTDQVLTQSNTPFTSTKLSWCSILSPTLNSSFWHQLLSSHIGAWSTNRVSIWYSCIWYGCPKNHNDIEALGKELLIVVSFLLFIRWGAIRCLWHVTAKHVTTLWLPDCTPVD
jgi:hypothetical protein